MLILKYIKLINEIGNDKPLESIFWDNVIYMLKVTESMLKRNYNI